MRKTCLLSLFLFFSALSLAQGQTETTTTESKGEATRQQLEKVIVEEKEGLPLEIDSYFRYMPKRGVDKQSGSVGLAQSASEISYAFKAFGEFPVEFYVQTEYIGINNSTVVKLPSHLTSFSTSVEVTLPFFNFDKTHFRLGVGPSFSSDNWNFKASSLRISSRYMLIYQPDAKWTFVAGALVTPKTSGVFTPFAGFIYQPNDKWAFNIIPENPNITYAINDKLSVFVEGDLNFGEFVVNKNDLANDEGKETRLKFREIMAGTGIKYQLNKNIAGSVTIGGAFNRNFQYQESYGKVNIKNGFFSEFRLEIAL